MTPITHLEASRSRRHRAAAGFTLIELERAARLVDALLVEHPPDPI